jgi:XTP/dITP diphosphohydrolase
MRLLFYHASGDFRGGWVGARKMTETPSLKLLIATGNRGKVNEILLALDNLPLKFHDLSEHADVLRPDESGTSYEQNAIIKARSYAKQTGLWALADDSGLEVATLEGAPGIWSARFGGHDASDTERINLLLSKLSAVETEERLARFICVVAIAEPAGGVINIAKGICKGRIAKEPAGKTGFGFDPVFIPEGYELTFAQMPSLVKSKISHRAKALAATREFLARFSQSLTPGLPGS